MEHFFSGLHNKPYEYRRNVALGVACIVTLVIFSIWVVTTKERFDARFESMTKDATSTTASGVKGIPTVQPASPLEAISRTFSEGFDTIQKQFEELSKLGK